MYRTVAYIEKDPETGFYVATVPGIPGAHTQAGTLDELQENLKEVVEALLGGDGRRGKKPVARIRWSATRRGSGLSKLPLIDAAAMEKLLLEEFWPVPWSGKYCRRPKSRPNNTSSIWPGDAPRRSNGVRAVKNPAQAEKNKSHCETTAPAQQALASLNRAAECFSCYTALMVILNNRCGGSGDGEGSRQKVNCPVCLSERELICFLKNVPFSPTQVL